MRVVLDTNVLMSAFISPEGTTARVLKLWLGGEFDLVTSERQIEEFRRISRYEHLQPRLKPNEIGAFVNDLRKSAVMPERLPNVDLSPDPDDNHILAAALAGEAQYLVTGDKPDLLALERVQGVRVLTVRAFVEIMGG